MDDSPAERRAPGGQGPCRRRGDRPGREASPAQSGAGLSAALQQELAACFPASHVAIWTAVAQLAPGTVASYGAIARRAGLPRRARLVSRALGNAPPGLGLPWHRVLRADGRIAFAPGSEWFVRQRRLLQAEGLRVDERGRLAACDGKGVDPAADLDACLWRLTPP